MKYIAKQVMSALDLMKIHYAGSSKNSLKDYFRNGRVRINGKVVKIPSTQLSIGDELAVGKAHVVVENDLPFEFIYEDKEIIIVGKPAGILTSGEGITNKPTLHALVDEYVGDKTNGRVRAYVVHRLDKEVGGLVMFAKSEQVVEALQSNWKNFTKKYLALTRSEPPAEEGTIDTWLVEHKMKMHVARGPSENAVHAITHYRWLRYIGENSLFEVTLETGKKNQIRAHLNHIGCPIIGDRKYGDDGPNNAVRLMASELEIFHPVTGKKIGWKISPSKKFLNP